MKTKGAFMSNIFQTWMPGLFCVFVECQWLGDSTINWHWLRFSCYNNCFPLWLILPAHLQIVFPVHAFPVPKPPESSCAASPWGCCSLPGSPHWVNPGCQGQHRSSWGQAAAPGLACRGCQARREGCSAAKFKPLCSHGKTAPSKPLSLWKNLLPHISSEELEVKRAKDLLCI